MLGGGGCMCVWDRVVCVCVCVCVHVVGGWRGWGGWGWGVIIFKRDNFVNNLLCIQPGNLEFNLKVVVDNIT